MGKTTGFKEFSRAVEPYRPVKERLLDFKEIYTDHDDEKLSVPVSYTHLRAHETRHDLVCRLLLEKK